jgi:Tol biopolymer transport system component
MRLFLVDLTTGRTRPLGETSGNERWSPVGARLAVSERHGFFLIDAASGNRTRLLRSHVSSFDFTPDGSSIVLARSKGSVYLDFERSDLFLLGLSDHRLKRLTRDGHSRSPLVSRSGIAYVRFKPASDAYEVWLMGRDGRGQRLLARCCETKWYTTHVSIHGFATVALSADGKHLLACQPWEGGCYPVAIALPDGRRFAFPETRKLGTPKESASAVDLTRDGRTALIVVNPWDDEPGPRLLYAVPFTGGKPTLLARGVADGRWRR